ncbi:hypothetical protein VTN02DRAFT_2994 [Thermoascus thermophilus]
MAVMHDLDGKYAIGTIFFCLSAWGIEAGRGLLLCLSITKLVTEDRRLRSWHPLLWKDDYTLYFPGNPESAVVPDY